MTRELDVLYTLSRYASSADASKYIREILDTAHGRPCENSILIRASQIEKEAFFNTLNKIQHLEAANIEICTEWEWAYYPIPEYLIFDYDTPSSDPSKVIEELKDKKLRAMRSHAAADTEKKMRGALKLLEEVGLCPPKA